MIKGRKTIIVEDRFSEMFNYLPKFDGYDIVFKIGTHLDLMSFFMQSTGADNYPLLWLERPFVEEHTNRSKVSLPNLKFVLAVETNNVILDEERMELTFKPYLMPIVDKLLDLFITSNIVSWDGNFTVTKFPNYSNSEANEHGFADVWDAVKLEMSNLIISDDCLREIKL